VILNDSVYLQMQNFRHYSNVPTWNTGNGKARSYRGATLTWVAACRLHAPDFYFCGRSPCLQWTGGRIAQWLSECGSRNKNPCPWWELKPCLPNPWKSFYRTIPAHEDPSTRSKVGNRTWTPIQYPDSSLSQWTTPAQAVQRGGSKLRYRMPVL
jgi:hypothetical protein